MHSFVEIKFWSLARNAGALHGLGFIFYFEFVCKVNLFLRGLLLIICTVDYKPAVLLIVKIILLYFPLYCIYLYLLTKKSQL